MKTQNTTLPDSFKEMFYEYNKCVCLTCLKYMVSYCLCVYMMKVIPETGRAY